MLGISLVLLAFLVFSFIDTGVKWLSILGLPALQLAFMRYAGHFVLSLVVAIRSGAGISILATDRPFLTNIRALALAISTIFNFFALQYLPLSLTATILFLAPIIVCGLAWPVLGERIGLWRVLAILVGFLGVVIAIKPTSPDFHWAIFLSLGAAIGFAFYQLLTRLLAGVVATDTQQFYTGFVGTAILLPFAILNWQNPTSATDWIILLSLGIFGFFGHELLTRAYRYSEAYRLSPFAYSFMLYLTLWSFLVFNQIPDINTVIGAVLVIGAGLFIWFRERARARNA